MTGTKILRLGVPVIRNHISYILNIENILKISNQISIVSGKKCLYSK